MGMRIAVIVLTMISSYTTMANEASLGDHISMVMPAVGYSRLLAGQCPGTKVSTECQTLTKGGKASSCCPTCDLVWPATVSAYQEAIKDPTPANVFLATARSVQLSALAVAGSAGAVPFVGDAAGNPASAIVTGLDMILPQQVSDETKCMREQFVQMTEKMEQMETKILDDIRGLKDQVTLMEIRIRDDIKDLKSALVAQNFYAEYMTFRKKLSNLRLYFNNLQIAITKGNCKSANRETCEAVMTWINHCDVISPCNHEDPNQLFQELKTLVTEKFMGRSLLEAAATDDSSLLHLLGIYNTISNDILELNMLNIKCAVAVKNKEDLRQRLLLANDTVAAIKKTLAGFLKPYIKAEVDKDTQRLITQTREFDDARAIDQALDRGENTAHGDLIARTSLSVSQAATELSKIYPFFRTYCTPWSRNGEYQEIKEEVHNMFLAPPVFQPSARNEDMQMFFKKTPPRIHLSSMRSFVPTTTVCYTYLPEDNDKLLETIVNNVEFWSCSEEYTKWRRGSGIMFDRLESSLKDWKPINSFCKPWQIQKGYFPAGTEKVTIAFRDMWKKLGFND